MTRTLPAAMAAAVLAASDAGAICCPFPVPGLGVQIASLGQLNLVIREEGTIRLVPNVRVYGNSEDFALVVPTPALPSLSPVEDDLWAEAAALTAPARRDRGMECSDPVVVEDVAVADSDRGDGVLVLGQQSVGAFDATFIAADSADSLVAWLNDNGFLIAPEQAARFEPLVADGWVFTAMKLQDSVEMPVDGWNTNVDPVEFRFAADALEIPLDVLAINMGSWLPVVVYSVDDHRTTLSGFTTTYANRITVGEAGAIADRYPAIARYLPAGRMLTRLDHTFTSPDEMHGRLRLTRAPRDDELRLLVSSSRVPADLVLLATPLFWFKLRARYRRRRS